MAHKSQITTTISDSTLSELDAWVEKTGDDRDQIINDAIAHYFEALGEIPPEFIIPKRMFVTAETMDMILDQMENPPPPTPAMVELFARFGGRM